MSTKTPLEAGAQVGLVWRRFFNWWTIKKAPPRVCFSRCDAVCGFQIRYLRNFNVFEHGRGLADLLFNCRPTNVIDQFNQLTIELIFGL